MKIIGGVKLYDSDEVCALLGICMNTLTKYRREGRIKYLTLGHSRYTTDQDLREFVQGAIRPKRSK